MPPAKHGPALLQHAVRPVAYLLTTMNDSDTVPLDYKPSSKRNKVTFDPTINLGHILTFVGFIATGAIGYFDLRERIALAEERTKGIEQSVTAEKVRNEQTMRELREDLREVRRGVSDLLQRKDK
jgi:hypothetical protein